MVLSWSRRRVFRRARKGKDVPGGATNINDGDLDVVDVDVVVPTHFRCPITLDLMSDPVTLSTGITYDRDSIEKWVESGNRTCPVTNQPLTTFDMIPNHAIRRMIQEWCVEHRSFGFERIPTPRIPVTQYEVSEICTKIMSATQRGDYNKCQQLVGKIKTWGKESERNKKCIVENGATGALASAFDSFANDSIEKNLNVLEEILSALNWMFPLQIEEAQKCLGSQASLRCMVWFLKHQDLAGKEKSIVALRELLSYGNEEHLNVVAKIEGVNELLVEFIRKRLSPTITKASLAVVFYMISSSPSSSSNKMKQRFIELGLVSALLEILLDSERSLCEKALAIFDSLCSCKEGRDKAYSNALTIPVLVKKILRVSALATECSVSAIWKLCKNGGEEKEEKEEKEEHDDEEEEGDVMVEALQVGAFQKLLVVLQIGCGDETKVKATELLKLLNRYGSGMECVDSDFKNLKRSH